MINTNISPCYTHKVHVIVFSVDLGHREKQLDQSGGGTEVNPSPLSCYVTSWLVAMAPEARCPHFLSRCVCVCVQQQQHQQQHGCLVTLTEAVCVCVVCSCITHVVGTQLLHIEDIII